MALINMLTGSLTALLLVMLAVFGCLVYHGMVFQYSTIALVFAGGWVGGVLSMLILERIEENRWVKGWENFVFGEKK